VFVHGRSDFQSYSQFFGNLSVLLSQCNAQQQILGSDDEAAICQCFSHFFPAAATVVCSRLLRENIIRKLDDLLGKSSAVRRDILQDLFGQGGLRDCCDVVRFDAVAGQLRQGVLATAPSQFVDYFERR
jgi:hypothetical protein